MRQRLTKFWALWVLPLSLGFVCGSCTTKPGKETQLAWEKSFQTVILDGYTNFEGHFVDGDAGVYIFSYTAPPRSVQELEAIILARNSDFTRVKASSDSLLLRRSIAYSKDNGFDEYNFRIDSKSGKVTVMFANLDSKAEMRLYKHFQGELETAHKNYVSTLR